VDNITHGLLGIAIGMVRRRDGGPEGDAPLSDTDRAVSWATFAAAELPDIDIFFGRGPMAELAYHRGWTHALVMAPVVAAVATLATKLIWRKAKAGTVYGWSLLAVLIAHLFDDYLTGWGTRLLLPFSQARLGLDWVPIVDILFTVPLAVAVWRAWKRPRQRRRIAALALTYLLVYAVGYRGLAHTAAEAQVRRAYAGRPVAQMQVSPSMFNPAGWSYAVDLGDRYEQGAAYPWGLGRPTETLKAPEDRVTAAVRSAPEVQPFFAQFRYPLITYRAEGDGYVVKLEDIRYKLAGRSGMSYEVHLSKALAVTEIAAGGW
jgi:inner membrane protein